MSEIPRLPITWDDLFDWQVKPASRGRIVRVPMRPRLVVDNTEPDARPCDTEPGDAA